MYPNITSLNEIQIYNIRHLGGRQFSPDSYLYFLYIFKCFQPFIYVHCIIIYLLKHTNNHSKYMKIRYDTIYLKIIQSSQMLISFLFSFTWNNIVFFYRVKLINLREDSNIYSLLRLIDCLYNSLNSYLSFMKNRCLLYHCSNT